MNREIIFKAKRRDNGKWLEGYYVYCRKRHYILPVVNKAVGFDEREDEWVEIVPETLCQYTGLTDKNGQKIWENDILKAHLDENYPEDITYTKIIWSECRFCTKENNSSDIEMLGKWDAEYFETCGNIFDNPELLEG